ncbi:MAG: Thiol-disulfide oxidoreductase ResA [Bacteroidota bacterium]|jgi:thiol-disulfide isomerase/thioredoxin
MKKTIAFLAVSLFFNAFLNAQSITGNFNQMHNESIKLEGFDGFKTYPISSSTTDEKGNFKLTYSAADYGMGYLVSKNSKPFIVILNEEKIELIGESLNFIETIKITKNQENQWFEQYAKEHPLRERALSAWNYLEKMYAQEPLFSVQKTASTNILSEKKRIKAEDTSFLVKLPKSSYVSWFIPIRKLVSSAATVAQYQTEEIPATIEGFRAIDYTDHRLYKSGLLKESIENHYWLLENCGKPLDAVFVEMKKSIDAMLVNLVKDPKKFNEVTTHLFQLLERHSLFTPSEYLALNVLNQNHCTLDSDLAKQLESYRAMKKGTIAPDMVFDPSFFANNTNTLSKLSDSKAQYTVVVFGASWCPQCQEELPEIASLYSKWKSKSVEVVFIGLENDKNTFIDFAKNFPFPSYSDLKKWDAKIVKDYFVFATPTLFLLDNTRKIILRPNSVKQMDAWVDFTLKN